MHICLSDYLSIYLYIYIYIYLSITPPDKRASIGRCQ